MSRFGVRAVQLSLAIALLVWTLSSPPLPSDPQVVINEVLVSNRFTNFDEDHDSSDWVEIYNAGTTTVDLAGYGLSDDIRDLNKWTFPEVRLQPGEFLLVWCSGKNRKAPPKEGLPPGETGNFLHANFRLDRGGGEKLLLTLPGGDLQNALVIPLQTEDRSYGRMPNGAGEFYYQLHPTPASANRGPASGRPISSRPEFSREGGELDGPFELEMEVQLPLQAFEIRYTTDGSTPTPGSAVYKGPIAIRPPPSDSGRFGMVVRAAAFSRGEAVTRTETQSYFFNVAAFQLPILSVAMSPRAFATVHGNVEGRGMESEREGHLEVFEGDGTRAAATGIGLRLHGETSRMGPMERNKSYRVYFRGIYGDRKLRYPIIEGTLGPGEGFDKLVLKGNSDDGFPDVPRASYIRDSLLRGLQREMGDLAPRGAWYNLFINMQYRGIYNVVERVDGEFFALHRPGEAESWDVVASSDSNTVVASEGDLTAWTDLHSSLTRPDLSDEACYRLAREMMELDNFVRYLVLNVWAQNHDWPNNNFLAARPRRPDGKWIFLVWDAGGLGAAALGVQFDTLDTIYARRRYPVPELIVSLMRSHGFQRAFLEEFERNLAGTLQPDNVSAAIHQLRDIIAPDMANELSLREGTITAWRDNVEGMEVFARLRNEAVRELLFRSRRFTFRDPRSGEAGPKAPP